MIRKSCYYYEWFGDYSLDCCNNPNRKKLFSADECKGCNEFITSKNYQIAVIKRNIAWLKRDLAKLEGKTK